MITVLLSFLLFAVQAPEQPRGLPEEASLEYLCAQYEVLSDQMTVDFLATQPSLEGGVSGLDVSAQIEAVSRYRQTKQTLKGVVLLMGGRECPADLDSEFPALL